MNASELAETYVNGNRTDVRDALAEMPPLVAAATALRIEHSMLGDAKADFRRSVRHWAEQ